MVAIGMAWCGSGSVCGSSGRASWIVWHSWREGKRKRRSIGTGADATDTKADSHLVLAPLCCLPCS